MIVKNSIIAKLFRVNGIVIYPFIFLAPKNPDPVLINHELIHMNQIKRLGVFKFYRSYLWEYLINRKKGLTHDQAYRSISYEQEAYRNASNLAYLRTSPDKTERS